MIERLSAKEYAPDRLLTETYVDVLDLHALYEKIAFRSNVVLVGPKGIGKTLSVAAFAGKVNCPIVTFDCSEDVRRSHLYGSHLLRGDESPFVLGPIPTAVEIANEVGECILCLEEINALTPQSQKMLNPLADFRKRIELPEARRVFRLKDNAKLWFTGTMNDSVYGGVYVLNDDLKSRLRLVPLTYPDEKRERKILQNAAKGLDAQTLEDVVTLARESRQGVVGYALSTRDLIHLLEDIQYTDVKTALWLVSGKFEGNDQTWIEQRIKSIFGVTLRNKNGRRPK